MNILREYTWDYIKRNKKSSLTITIAMLIATIFMNIVGLYAYSIWRDGVDTTIKHKGNWHGELYDVTWGKDLNYIKSFASVETVMVKGKWYAISLENSKRPYLVMRDADQEYWTSMSEQHSIIEGHVPQRTGEIVVSKQFMEAYPEYHVGQSITLPRGDRVSAGQVLDPRSHYIEGESFENIRQVTYTIVGVLDLTTSSSVPAYLGMGYLEHEDIQPTDDLTVYLRFKNRRSTYKELPKIAEGLGWTKDEYGEYLLRYNSGLLAKYFIFPETNYKPSLVDLSMPLVYVALAVCIVGLFVFIIHNAFEISMNHRKKQLGMFKSIGATPKQIKASITFEALVLSILPLIIGILVSCGLWKLYVDEINKVNQTYGWDLLNYHINIGVELMIVLLVLLTAWLSAYIPSRKLGRKMPIEILKGNLVNSTLKRNKKNKKSKSKHKVTIVDRIKKSVSKNRQTNIYDELVSNEFKANKHSFRTAIISLTLSFLLFMVFMTGLASGDLVNDIYYYKELKNNITIGIYDGNPIEAQLSEVIKQHPKIKQAIERNTVMGTIWVSSDQESDEFKALGGFQRVVDEKRYSVIKKDEQYRVRTCLVGLDDESFKAYCEQIGTDYKDYYNEENIKCIVYNQVNNTYDSTRRNIVSMPLLDIKQGETLVVSEKVYEDDPGNSELEMEIGAITDELPEIDMNVGNYIIMQIMPKSVYESMLNHWNPEKAIRAMGTRVLIQVEDQDIREVSSWLTQECEKLYGSGDFEVWDAVKEKEGDAAGDKLSMIMATFIAGLFGVIGISNAFFTVYTSLEQRRRSFAILSSIGISVKGIYKLLIKEAVQFAIRPIIYASIVEVIWMGILIKMDDSTWIEFLSYVPIGQFIAFALLILAAIGMAYFIGSYQIRKQNIVDVIKDETV